MTLPSHIDHTVQKINFSRLAKYPLVRLYHHNMKRAWMINEG